MTQFYSARTATALIIANMVGVGVFTSLGYQLADIQNGFPILLLWVLGGVMSLCGAASYAELGSALPRSGGEYNFLGRIYHPMAGFVSGWISATIGFAAPTAAIAIAFGAYAVQVLPGIPEGWSKAMGILLVLSVTIIHARNRSGSGGFQFLSTALKIILILVFCVLALAFVPDPQPVEILPQEGDATTVFSSAFGVALIYATFAYTGWNAATYISGELENPQRDLPKILIFGTLLVTVIYVALNFVFLKVAPVEAMINKEEIGFIAAKYAFGEVGGRITAAMLALLFISSVSAMILAGPRALQAIGEDFPALGFLGKVNAQNIPANAIFVQAAITIALILTSTFKFILIFAGSMLALNSMLAVLGVMVLRAKEPDLERPYKTWAYPVTPLHYIAITTFMLIVTLRANPGEALFGLIVIVTGIVFYLISNRVGRV